MVTALVLQLIQCIIKVPEAEEKKLKEKAATEEKDQVSCHVCFNSADQLNSLSRELNQTHVLLDCFVPHHNFVTGGRIP